MVAALCAAAAWGCSEWTQVPASQVPRLLGARTDDIEVTDLEGHRVTISRSQVQQVTLEPRDNYRLMMVRPRTGPARGQVVAVHEDRADDADVGWRAVPEFQDRVRMQLRGEVLTVRDERTEASVSLRDIDHVKIGQLSNGMTALWIIVPIASVLGTGLILTSFCSLDGVACWYSGGPR